MVDPINLYTKNRVQTFVSHGHTIDVPRWTDKNGTSHGHVSYVLPVLSNAH